MTLQERAEYEANMHNMKTQQESELSKQMLDQAIGDIAKVQALVAPQRQLAEPEK